MELAQRINGRSVQLRLHINDIDDPTTAEQVKWSVILGAGYDRFDTHQDERVIVGEHTPILSRLRPIRSTRRERPMTPDELQRSVWDLMFWLILPANSVAPEQFSPKYDTTRTADLGEDEAWLRNNWRETFSLHYRDYWGPFPFAPAAMIPHEG